MSKLESTIQKEISKYLTSKGYLVIRHNGFTRKGYLSAYRIENTNGTKGLADLSVEKDGRKFYIETKTEKGKQKPEQVEFEKLCTEKGISYYIARSVLEVQDILELEEQQRN